MGGKEPLLMKGNISWHAVLLVVVKALLAGLAAISADQLAGQPIAQALRSVGPLAALGQPLPHALLLNSPVLLPPGTSVSVSV